MANERKRLRQCREAIIGKLFQDYTPAFEVPDGNYESLRDRQAWALIATLQVVGLELAALNDILAARKPKRKTKRRA